MSDEEKINPIHLRSPGEGFRKSRQAFARSGEDSTEHKLILEAIPCCIAHHGL
jgi:hypothetical protein